MVLFLNLSISLHRKFRIFQTLSLTLQKIICYLKRVTKKPKHKNSNTLFFTLQQNSRKYIYEQNQYHSTCRSFSNYKF